MRMRWSNGDAQINGERARERVDVDGTSSRRPRSPPWQLARWCALAAVRRQRKSGSSGGAAFSYAPLRGASQPHCVVPTMTLAAKRQHAIRRLLSLRAAAGWLHERAARAPARLGPEAASAPLHRAPSRLFNWSPLRRINTNALHPNRAALHSQCNSLRRDTNQHHPPVARQ